MRPLVFALAATLAAPGLLGTADQRTEIRAAHPLQVVYPHATLDGVCSLVDVERHATHLELYFITSARFFKTAQGEPLAAAPPEVRVTMDDGTEVNVLREHRYLPIGSLIDIAVLRADVSENRVAAASMGFTVPPPGHSLEIVTYDRGGTRQVETQRIRFASTRFVVGDRDLSDLSCLGAPALDGDEIVGVVSECEPGRTPLMTPLSVAFPFLSRHIPGLVGRPTLRE
jgi:hypothetical protein